MHKPGKGAALRAQTAFRPVRAKIGGLVVERHARSLEKLSLGKVNAVTVLEAFRQFELVRR